MDRTGIVFLIIGIISIRDIGGEKTTLDHVVKRLDAIEVKLAKVDALFGSLDQLCKSLNVIQTQFDGDNNRVETAKQEDHTQGLADNEKRYNEDQDSSGLNISERYTGKLEIISVESSGVQNNEINVTVVLTTPDGCTGEWFLGREGGQQSKSIGQVDKKVISGHNFRFTLKHSFRSVDTLQTASLAVYSVSHNFIIYFDVGALNISGTQYLDPIKREILDYLPTVRVPGHVLETEGFKTTVVVSENVVEALNEKRYYLELNMNLFNTSVAPVSYVDIWAGRYANEFLSVDVNNGSRNELLITLDKSYAIYGGIITLRIPQNVSNYLSGLDYGIEIRLINEDVGDVIPYGAFGLYRFSDREYVKGPFLSITCLAFGIPIPSVKMFKKRKGGTLTELKPDYAITHDLYHFKVLQFDQTKSAKPEREYVCQASNGNDTIEHEMSYETYQRVAIDDNKTRLVKSNTKTTVITCKATGNPRPRIELRAESQYGRNLLDDNSVRYKPKFATKDRMVKVTLVISPPDKSISVVHCLAIQGKYFDETRVFKEIRIFKP